MDLVFTDIEEKLQCGSKILEHGFGTQCPNLTSRLVTIPKGLHYFAGKLNFSQSKLRTIIPICAEHESRIKSDYAGLFSSARK